ncbi:hypothetical protein Ga0074812_118136 [Parafrankia irregularis]|uniref:Uncharacterized protein n=1 Tax=Parafrankia irregularis TaxID=795642 RepID=A0A0S4QU58_9ACTN|nr:hypothetical protein Ga0074812_118136 [Parafrankia irregularis]
MTDVHRRGAPGQPAVAVSAVGHFRRRWNGRDIPAGSPAVVPFEDGAAGGGIRPWNRGGTCPSGFWGRWR